MHSMTMFYIYEVFERLFRLWVGIWLHTHTIATTDACPDLERLAQIQPYASMQTAYGYFVLLAVCSAICSAKFGFFCQAEHMNG
jgi:hypothetical protein